MATGYKSLLRQRDCLINVGVESMTSRRRATIMIHQPAGGDIEWWHDNRPPAGGDEVRFARQSAAKTLYWLRTLGSNFKCMK